MKPWFHRVLGGIVLLTILTLLSLWIWRHYQQPTSTPAKPLVSHILPPKPNQVDSHTDNAHESTRTNTHATETSSTTPPRQTLEQTHRLPWTILETHHTAVPPTAARISPPTHQEDSLPLDLHENPCDLNRTDNIPLEWHDFCRRYTPIVYLLDPLRDIDPVASYDHEFKNGETIMNRPAPPGSTCSLWETLQLPDTCQTIRVNLNEQRLPGAHPSVVHFLQHMSIIGRSMNQQAHILILESGCTSSPNLIERWIQWYRTLPTRWDVLLLTSGEGETQGWTTLMQTDAGVQQQTTPHKGPLTHWRLTRGDNTGAYIIHWRYLSRLWTQGMMAFRQHEDKRKPLHLYTIYRELQKTDLWVVPREGILFSANSLYSANAIRLSPVTVPPRIPEADHTRTISTLHWSPPFRHTHQERVLLFIPITQDTETEHLLALLQTLNDRFLKMHTLQVHIFSGVPDFHNSFTTPPTHPYIQCYLHILKQNTKAALFQAMHHRLQRILTQNPTQAPTKGFFLLPTYQIIENIEWDLSVIEGAVAVHSRFTVRTFQDQAKTDLRERPIPHHSTLQLGPGEELSYRFSEKLWGGTTTHFATQLQTLHGLLCGDEDNHITLPLYYYTNYYFLLHPPILTLTASYDYPTYDPQTNTLPAHQYKDLVRHRIVPLMAVPHTWEYTPTDMKPP